MRNLILLREKASRNVTNKSMVLNPTNTQMVVTNSLHAVDCYQDKNTTFYHPKKPTLASVKLT